MADTAGIREAKNEVEKKGISLALGKSKEADLNIVVIDNSSKKINKEIQSMINKDTIILLNKSDKLSKNKASQELMKCTEKTAHNLLLDRPMLLSAKTASGAEELSKKILDWMEIKLKH